MTQDQFRIRDLAERVDAGLPGSPADALVCVPAAWPEVEPDVWTAFGGVVEEPRRNPASGALGLRAFGTGDRDIEQALRTLGRALDPESEFVTRYPERPYDVTETEDWEAYSRAESPPLVEVRRTGPAGLPAVGPGGRVTATPYRDGHLIEAAVRRGVDTVEGGEWRDPGAVAEAVATWAEGLGVDPAALWISLEIGYFEASSLERQQLLRPVALMVVDLPPERDYDVGWRDLIVEPLTNIPGVATAAGIDNWHVSGRSG